MERASRVAQGSAARLAVLKSVLVVKSALVASEPLADQFGFDSGGLAGSVPPSAGAAAAPAFFFDGTFTAPNAFS